LQLNQDSFEDLDSNNIQTPLGKYMLSRFYLAINETREFLEVYRFNDAATTLYRFLWGEFCDWGIELSKASKESVGEMGSIFKESLKLLHPFMPFITEYLYHRLSNTSLEESQSIMVLNYPKTGKLDNSIMQQFEQIIEAIVSVRRCKTLIEQGNQKIEKAYIRIGESADKELMKPFIEKLAKVGSIEFVNESLDKCVKDVSDTLESMIATENIDLSPIIQKLEKQKEKLDKEITKLSSMLNNERFVANAPEAIITENKTALKDAESKVAKIIDELQNLTK